MTSEQDYSDYVEASELGDRETCHLLCEAFENDRNFNPCRKESNG